ncbi:MAG: shikimate dehydrogenase [Acidobacteria bacterium]|nr:MAG: shikimate dehydrogenase [Acidobacteriota bacterium]
MTVLPMNYAARSLRLRIPRICVTISGSDPAELLDKAESVLRENPLIELRLDYLKAPSEAMPRLRRLVELRPDATIIATCRRTEAGGRFRGSVQEQLDLLRKATEAGCPALDVEIETAEAITGAEWEDLRARAAIVLSSHDFKATVNLEETFERMRSFTADFYKVVGTATCLHDNVVMIRFLEQHCSEYSMVGMCMGEQGLLSRILSIRAGGAFTFGSAARGEATAPGQPTYRELRDFYRVEQIEAVTKVYGVAGDPVSHSMSPWVMNSSFRRENVNAVYLPLHAKTLQDLLSTVADLPLDGLSVTMPYKQAIVDHLDNSDVLTQRTGACNTVVRAKDGRLFGFNTDVYGIVAATESRVPLQGGRILVLGAGGAARAAVFGFRAKGSEVFILNRTLATGQALAKQSDSKTIKRSELTKSTFDVIFNATPVGMGSDENTPLEENEINALWVFDSVYNPIETGFLKMAQAKGCGTISGAEMFVHQAARQFEIWTGKPAPIDTMRQVLLRQLGAVAENAAPVQTVVLPKAKVIASNVAETAPSESLAPISEPEIVAEEDAKPEANIPSKPVITKAGAKSAAKKAAPAKAVPGKATPPKVLAKAEAVKAVPAKSPKTPAKAASKPVAKKAAEKPAAKKVAAKKQSKAKGK